MTPPFTDCGVGEILARVVIAYTKMCMRRHNLNGLSPVAAMQAVVLSLPPKLTTVSTAALALQVWLLNRRGTSRDWAAQVTQRSRFGFDYRSCLYVEYKSTRHNPRVTNRGVRHRGRTESDGK